MVKKVIIFGEDVFEKYVIANTLYKGSNRDCKDVFETGENFKCLCTISVDNQVVIYNTTGIRKYRNISDNNVYIKIMNFINAIKGVEFDKIFVVKTGCIIGDIDEEFIHLIREVFKNYQHNTTLVVTSCTKHQLHKGIKGLQNTYDNVPVVWVDLNNSRDIEGLVLN